MAQQTATRLDRRAWTQLTDADATNITFQVIEGPVWIMGAVDATAPTTPDPASIGAIKYTAGQGELNVAVADLFPGLSSPDRVFAWAEFGGRVSFGHA